MRTKRAVSPRYRRQHRLPGAVAVSCLALVITAAVAGCTGSTSSSAAVAPAAAVPESSSAAAAGGSASAQSGAFSGGAPAAAKDTAKLAPAGRQLIYTAQLTVRAANVESAVSRATSIVTGAGGYVSAETSSAGNGQPSQATTTVTFKVPAAAYASTLAALSGRGLGTQLSLAQQAQDVTQQVADVDSRVASDRAAIAQLRALLSHAGDVGQLLSVQNQINSEESDLESMLAQQSALDHETAYATMTVTVYGPKAAAKPGTPPPGFGHAVASGWHALGLTLGWLATILGAIAPFVGVLLVLGAIVWRGRRWLRRRQQRPTDDAGPA